MQCQPLLTRFLPLFCSIFLFCWFFFFVIFPFKPELFLLLECTTTSMKTVALQVTKWVVSHSLNLVEICRGAYCHFQPKVYLSFLTILHCNASKFFLWMVTTCYLFEVKLWRKAELVLGTVVSLIFLHLISLWLFHNFSF